MPWPLSQDYNEAVQDPSFSFADAELRAGEVVTNDLGLPVPRSGNFADVYEVRAPAGGRRWAVKCFTRAVAGQGERYAAISAHLQQARLPFTVEFQYLQQGIRVGAQWYPILKMDWVEGFLLNEFVRQHIDRPPMLDALSHLWAKLARRLARAGAAHADLQHGNILLVPGRSEKHLAIKLIDYDGMFVPTLAAVPILNIERIHLKGKPAKPGKPIIRQPSRPSTQPRIQTFILEEDVLAVTRLLQVDPQPWRQIVRIGIGDQLVGQR